MDLGIAGKHVLVTGASQGLGKVATMDFAREGCRVSIVARRTEKLKEIIATIGGKKKGHSYYAVDLFEENAPSVAVNELVKRNGHFDIVLHNIGGTLNVKDPLATVDDWYRVWRFNVGIAIEINRLVVPAMQNEQWGRIVHISSISAESIRGSGPYSAAKAYLNAYVKSLGRSLAPTGIVVSALMPGAFIADGGHWDHIRKSKPAIIEDFLSHHQAIGRLGLAEEISAFALFMASRHVTFATSAVIPVDGGTM